MGCERGAALLLLSIALQLCSGRAASPAPRGKHPADPASLPLAPLTALSFVQDGFGFAVPCRPGRKPCAGREGAGESPGPQARAEPELSRAAWSVLVGGTLKAPGNSRLPWAAWLSRKGDPEELVM